MRGRGDTQTQVLADEVVQLLNAMSIEDFRQMKKFQDSYNALSAVDLEQKDNYFAAQARAGIKGLIILQKAAELYGQIKIELKDEGLSDNKINVDAVIDRIKEKLVSAPVSEDTLAKAKLLNHLADFSEVSQDLMFGGTAFNHISSRVLPSIWEASNPEIHVLNEQLKAIDPKYLEARRKWNEATSMELQGEKPEKSSAKWKEEFDVLDQLMKNVRALREEISQGFLQPSENNLAQGLAQGEEIKKTIDDFQARLFDDHIKRMEKAVNSLWSREGSKRAAYGKVKHDTLNHLKDTILNKYEDIVAGKTTLLDVINDWKNEKVHVDLGGDKRMMSNYDILGLQRRTVSRLFEKFEPKKSDTQIFIDEVCRQLEQSPTQRRKLT